MNFLFEGLVPNLWHIIALGAIIYGRKEIRSGRATLGKALILIGLAWISLIPITEIIFWAARAS